MPSKQENWGKLCKDKLTGFVKAFSLINTKRNKLEINKQSVKQALNVINEWYYYAIQAYLENMKVQKGNQNFWNVIRTVDEKFQPKIIENVTSLVAVYEALESLNYIVEVVPFKLTAEDFIWDTEDKWFQNDEMIFDAKLIDVETPKLVVKIDGEESDRQILVGVCGSVPLAEQDRAREKSRMIAIEHKDVFYIRPIKGAIDSKTGKMNPVVIDKLDKQINKKIIKRK